jgi:hypothetical protein
MLWLVQSNLINREDYEDIVAALVAQKCEWRPIKVMPFSDYIELGEQIDTTNVVALGSTTMLKIVHRLGWTPGVWWGPNFAYDKYIEHYGKEMLNYDANIYAFKDVPKFRGSRFIRPVQDSKAFAGEEIFDEQFETWQNQVLGTESGTFPETPVIVATPKKLLAEYRFFVVKGKIVAGSQYHWRGRLKTRKLDLCHTPDLQAFHYAEKQVERWQPADVFVMDVAQLDPELDERYHAIVELNGMNSCGVYESDVRAIIRAIEEM